MHPIVYQLRLPHADIAIGGYGAMLCAALLIGSSLCLRAAVRARLDAGATIAALGVTIASGFFGGWALHLLARIASGIAPGRALASPGLAVLGAVLAGIVGLRIACRRWQLPFLRLLDLSVPAFAAAHALGRVGCLLGGCCYGRPTDGALSLTYTDPRAPAAVLAVARHPVPLYEALLLLGLAIAFAAVPLRWPGSGRRVVAYLAIYCVARVGLESLRGDAVRGVFYGVSTSQLVAGAVFLACLWWARRYIGPMSRRASTVLVAAAFACAIWALSWTAVADRVRELTPSLPAVIEIGGGWFWMGSDERDVAFAVELCKEQVGERAACGQDRFAHEHPRHRVFVSPFRIDRTEVDNRAYRACVLQGICRPARTADQDARLGHPDQPVAGVTFAEARRYCDFRGGDLPTEAQWEYAARASSLRRFPWGQYWNSRVSNHAGGDGAAGEPDGYPFAAPVTAYPDGRSVHSLLNMAGNVWELTADRYQATYYEHSPSVDPQGPEDGSERVVRGGSWRTPAFALRVTHRDRLLETDSRSDVGFRCAYNVP